MNTNAMNGKKIKQVWWPDTESEQGRTAISTDESPLVMSATFHGEYDQFWVVQYKTIDGSLEEAARYNAKYLETIVWA